MSTAGRSNKRDVMFSSEAWLINVMQPVNIMSLMSGMSVIPVVNTVAVNGIVVSLVRFLGGMVPFGSWEGCRGLDEVHES